MLRAHSDLNFVLPCMLCTRPQPPTQPPSPTSRYAQECQTPEFGCGLDDVLRRQAWKLTGGDGRGWGQAWRHMGRDGRWQA